MFTLRQMILDTILVEITEPELIEAASHQFIAPEGADISERLGCLANAAVLGTYIMARFELDSVDNPLREERAQTMLWVLSRFADHYQELREEEEKVTDMEVTFMNRMVEAEVYFENQEADEEEFIVEIAESLEDFMRNGVLGG